MNNEEYASFLNHKQICVDLLDQDVQEYFERKDFNKAILFAHLQDARQEELTKAAWAFACELGEGA